MPLVEALISGAARAEVIMLEAEVRRLERRIAELEAELVELEKISVIDALAIANSVLVMICIPVLIILNRESEENERSNRDFYI